MGGRRGRRQQQQQQQQRQQQPRYDLKEQNRRHIPRFKTLGIDYHLTIDIPQAKTIQERASNLNHVLERAIADMTRGMNERDQIRFVMQTRELFSPISLPFMPVEDLTSQRIMFEVERVLQSHKDLYVNQRFDVNLAHVSLPAGSGRKKEINMSKRLRDKRCFIRIRNQDELCMARAIVVGMAKLENDPKYDLIKQGKSVQRTRALELHRKAGVPLQPCGIEEAKKFQTVLPHYQLVIVSAEHLNSIIYKGPTREKVIYLYLHHGHYDFITSMPGFIGRTYYCLECEMGYKTEEGRHHRRKRKCLSCFQEGCRGNISSWIYCAYCRRSFQGPGCFENHRRIGPQGGISVCKQYLKCKDCGKMQKEREMMMMRNKMALIYFLILNVPKTLESMYLILWWWQDQHGKEWMFKTCQAFCEWLFDKMHGATCIAHNFKGYDSHFILDYLYKNNVKPTLIMNDAKIMEMRVPDVDVRFIDSLKFFPMPQSKLPKTFGMKELKKGYFPHFFNTEENQHYVGPIPDVEYYDPDGMKPEARDAFLTWYQEQQTKNVMFNMQEELVAYC